MGFVIKLGASRVNFVKFLYHSPYDVKGCNMVVYAFEVILPGQDDVLSK